MWVRGYLTAFAISIRSVFYLDSSHPPRSVVRRQSMRAMLPPPQKLDVRDHAGRDALSSSSEIALPLDGRQVLDVGDLPQFGVAEPQVRAAS
jgi:hypothetical protein